MSNFENHKILVVDDDVETCENLRQVLALDGYEVDIVNSAAGARSSRDWSEYLAIILDHRLPDGSADELLPEINNKSPKTAVIIITGCPDFHASDLAAQQGAEDFFLKPLDLDILRSSLDQIARTRQAEQRATDAERLAVIGQMTAGIAHESRNAIQRIQTGVDILKLDLAESPDLLSQVHRIERANGSLRTMLDEIRDFAAPINLTKSDVDLSTVWRRAWKNVIAVNEDNNAKLSENTNHSDLNLSVDGFRFEQVFRNIFENSLSACDVPLVHIECVETGQSLRALYTRSPNGSLRIAIRDNGPGLALKQRQKIFEPFFTTKQKGTGLGLAIVKRSIEAHGGSVAIGNEPGAEIIITMPRTSNH